MILLTDEYVGSMAFFGWKALYTFIITSVVTYNFMIGNKNYIVMAGRIILYCKYGACAEFNIENRLCKSEQMLLISW